MNLLVTSKALLSPFQASMLNQFSTQRTVFIDDTHGITIFFQTIKANVGEISPPFLMSDMAEQFYNAWVAKCTKTHPLYMVCV